VDVDERVQLGLHRAIVPVSLDFCHDAIEEWSHAQNLEA
jgi:hypothetical protein